VTLKTPGVSIFRVAAAETESMMPEKISAGPETGPAVRYFSLFKGHIAVIGTERF